MDKSADEIRKNRTAAIIIILSFTYIFAVVAYRIITEWDLLILNPMIYGWDFFFALLLFLFSISLILFEDKNDILVLALSSLIPLFWEAFIEVLGWYFNLWEFAKHETDILVVIPFALQLGFEFYAFYFLLGMIYLGIYKSKLAYKIPIIVAICIGMTIAGWQGDLNIAMFDTVVLTFFIWLILDVLHLIAVIGFYRYFQKQE
ncbi:MAG: hypothetical protein ACTSR8_04840 [Promethearchaeota archaeon]